MNIPAKPTTYKGVRFRSRLEAGWAVMLDSCGFVSWTYETFTTPGGQSLTPHLLDDFRDETPTVLYDLERYTPDFRLTIAGVADDWCAFLELKPTWPNEEYLSLLRMAAWTAGRLGYELMLGVGAVRDDDEPVLVGAPFRSDTFFSRRAVTEVFGDLALENARHTRWELRTE